MSSLQQTLPKLVLSHGAPKPLSTDSRTRALEQERQARHLSSSSKDWSGSAREDTSSDEESFENLDRKLQAAKYLMSEETMIWFSSMRNESVPQTRLYFEKILHGLDPDAPAPKGQHEGIEFYYQEDTEAVTGDDSHDDQLEFKTELESSSSGDSSDNERPVGRKRRRRQRSLAESASEGGEGEEEADYEGEEDDEHE